MKKSIQYLSARFLICLGAAIIFCAVFAPLFLLLIGQKEKARATWIVGMFLGSAVIVAGIHTQETLK